MRRPKIRMVAVAVVWFMYAILCSGPVVVADQVGHHGSTAPTADSMVLKTIRNMRDQANVLKKSGANLLIGGPNIPIPTQGPGDDLWSGMLEVTQMNNPLISTECREGAVAIATEVIGSPESAEKHAAEHLEEWRQVLQGTRKMSIDQYLEHMVDCTSFCGPLIGSLIKCHVESARNTPSVIIMFNIDDPRDLYSFQFSFYDTEAIRRFARKMRSENKAILLEARASILNPRESLPHNIELSRRRAEVVKAALIDAGFPAEDILVKSLCWQPPRLAISEISDAYGFGGVRAGLSNPQFIDQSVVLLGYKRE